MDKLSIENVVRFSPIGEMTWSKRRRQTQLSTCQIKIKFQMDIYLSAGTEIPKGNSSERNENKLSKKEWKPTKPRQWDRTNFCNISVRVLNRMMMISFFKANLRHNSQNFKENDRRRPTIVVPPLFPDHFFCWPSLFIRVSVCVQRYLISAHISRYPSLPHPKDTWLLSQAESSQLSLLTVLAVIVGRALENIFSINQHQNVWWCDK